MLFYVDHTSHFERNTGVQRTVRAIARGLMEIGVPLQPVLWDWEKGGFISPSRQRLEHLSRWNGPPVSDWSTGRVDEPITSHPLDGWLMIAELVTGAEPLRQAADALGLKVCWLFHDMIPIRFAHFYGERGSAMRRQHEDYMDGFAQFEVVVPNSQTTAGHLIAHLKQRGLRYDHVHPLPLATEFGGAPRYSPPSLVRDESKPWQLLCVGSLERRKNHMGLFKALLCCWETTCFTAMS